MSFKYHQEYNFGKAIVNQRGMFNDAWRCDSIKKSLRFSACEYYAIYTCFKALANYFCVALGLFYDR